MLCDPETCKFSQDSLFIWFAILPVSEYKQRFTQKMQNLNNVGAVFGGPALFTVMSRTKVQNGMDIIFKYILPIF